MAEIFSTHRLTLSSPGQKLFEALSQAIPGLGRRQARAAILAGLVTLDGRLGLDPGALLGDGVGVVVDLSQGLRRIRLSQRHGSGAIAQRPFTILHQDADLIVLDKASGVAAAPTPDGEHGHIPELLRLHLRQLGEPVRYLGLVHRLDRDTSGCMVLALNVRAQRLLASQFAGESAHRIYRCLVRGGPRRDEETLTGRIGRGDDGRRSMVDEGEPGKSTITHLKVVHRYGRGSELEVRLDTGRTHQIRVQLAAIGCPVFGDRVYFRAQPRPPRESIVPGRGKGRGAGERAGKGPRRGAADPEASLRPLPNAPRLMLHARTLSLDHPSTGKRLSVDAPIPSIFTDFARLLASDQG